MTHALPILLVFAAAAVAPAAEDPRVLDPALHHLGDDRAGWPDAPAEPEGPDLRLAFEARRNEDEATLILRQRDVNDVWSVRLNGREVATLRRRKEDRTIGYRLPPGSLKDGENVLEIAPARPGDDVVLGEIHLDRRPLREALSLAHLLVTVIDADDGSPLPARITIVADDGGRPELYDTDAHETAVRAGLVYVAHGRLDAWVPAGSFDVYANRGLEWGVARARVSVLRGRGARLGLALRREVDTTGFVAADTHIHTVTFSGHGDASIDERMITLAAEGVEFAVATDHNHNTDYLGPRRRMGVSRWFTPVTGNEVTTKVGHFNAFPLDPGDPIPEYRLDDWVKLVAGMRAHGARVVILNHPRWPDVERGPFGAYGLDRRTGAFADGRALTVDAIELVNSCWLLDDALLKLQDWFALLDRGVDVKVVGASDSHTVGEPVGQGRTYLASPTDDPGRLDVERLCDAFLAGRMSVSLGLFLTATLEGAPLGALVRPAGDTLDLEVDLQAPSFVRPRRLQVYVNGVLLREEEVDAREGGPTRVRRTIAVPRPRRDAYLVVVALGDGVEEPFWPTMKDYTLAATEPFRVDADGREGFLWPRETAERLLPRIEATALDWEELLARCDGPDLPIGFHLVDLAFGVPRHRETLATLVEGTDSGALDDELLRYLKKRCAE